MTYNYYKILGISENSEVPEIKRAFRDLAKKYHPDHNKNSSGEYFIVLNKAYQVLSDPVSRRSYDQSIGIAAPSPFIFNEIPLSKAEKRAERRRKNQSAYTNYPRPEKIWDTPLWVKYVFYITGFLFGSSVTSFSFYFVFTGNWPFFMLWISFLGIIVLIDSLSGLLLGHLYLSSQLAGKLRAWLF